MRTAVSPASSPHVQKNPSKVAAILLGNKTYWEIGSDFIQGIGVFIIAVTLLVAFTSDEATNFATAVTCLWLCAFCVFVVFGLQLASTPLFNDDNKCAYRSKLMISLVLSAGFGTYFCLQIGYYHEATKNPTVTTTSTYMSETELAAQYLDFFLSPVFDVEDIKQGASQYASKADDQIVAALDKKVKMYPIVTLSGSVKGDATTHEVRVPIEDHVSFNGADFQSFWGESCDTVDGSSEFNVNSFLQCVDNQSTGRRSLASCDVCVAQFKGNGGCSCFTGDCDEEQIAGFLPDECFSLMDDPQCQSLAGEECGYEGGDDRSGPTCNSHDDCSPDTPFCYQGVCDVCASCHYCTDGVDNTCGSVCQTPTKGGTCDSTSGQEGCRSFCAPSWTGNMNCDLESCWGCERFWEGTTFDGGDCKTIMPAGFSRDMAMDCYYNPLEPHCAWIQTLGEQDGVTLSQDEIQDRINAQNLLRDQFGGNPRRVSLKLDFQNNDLVKCDSIKCKTINFYMMIDQKDEDLTDVTNPSLNSNKTIYTIMNTVFYSRSSQNNEQSVIQSDRALKMKYNIEFHKDMSLTREETWSMTTSNTIYGEEPRRNVKRFIKVSFMLPKRYRKVLVVESAEVLSYTLGSLWTSVIATLGLVGSIFLFFFPNVLHKGYFRFQEWVPHVTKGSGDTIDFDKIADEVTKRHASHLDVGGDMTDIELSTQSKSESVGEKTQKHDSFAVGS